MTENTAPATTWPETEAEVTADRMIACRTAHAIMLDARHSALYAAVPWDDKESPEYTPAIRRYGEGISATVTAAQQAVLLVELQKRSREDADSVARLLWEMTEAGDWLIEILWQYLNDRGVDADAVYRDAASAAQERYK